MSKSTVSFLLATTLISVTADARAALTLVIDTDAKRLYIHRLKVNDFGNSDSGWTDSGLDVGWTIGGTLRNTTKFFDLIEFSGGGTVIEHLRFSEDGFRIRNDNRTAGGGSARSSFKKYDYSDIGASRIAYLESLDGQELSLTEGTGWSPIAITVIPAAAVPEPSTTGTFLLGSLLMYRRWRRQSGRQATGNTAKDNTT